MNKKAQGVAVAFMLAVVLIILGLALALPVQEISSHAQNETSDIGGMNCTATTDDFVKAGCWITDLSPAYFIGGLMAIAGIVIGARLIWD